MEALALTILIFFGVIAVTALVFGIWIIVSIARLILRLFWGIGRILLPSTARLPSMPMATRGIVCQNQQCRASNPGGARFCRRCGQELPAAQHVNVRRAAML